MPIEPIREQAYMRRLKGSNNYLKNQTRKSLAKAVLSIIFFGAIFYVVNLRIYLTQLGSFEIAGLLLSLAPFTAGYYYLRKYRIYKGGLQGEKNVTKLLSKTLNDDYYMLNGVYLQGGGGDIDHLVFGPNGIFVLETKNWSGKIICNGDGWHRPGKRDMGSPSRQVKRNASKISHLIESMPSLKLSTVWVEGIVVFTNSNIKLNLNNPTVTILTLNQLGNHITTHKAVNPLNQQQIEQIAKEIQKQSANQR
jgi:hypothetical protein